MYMIIDTLFIFLFLLMCGDIHSNQGHIDTFNSSHSSSIGCNCLSILHLNIRSIRNKLDFINELCDFDILCFTETHLGQTFPMSDIFLSDFNPPIYKNRTDAGGGVLIYIKSHLAFKEMTVLSHPQLESVWVGVSSNKIEYLIGTVYRPPSALLMKIFSIQIYTILKILFYWTI